MALKILRLSGALGYEPSVAVYIYGTLVVAAEEERFVRAKHARNRMPSASAKFCLQQAGFSPADVDIITVLYGPTSIFGRARRHYAKRDWYAPDYSLDAILEDVLVVKDVVSFGLRATSPDCVNTRVIFH